MKRAGDRYAAHSGPHAASAGIAPALLILLAALVWSAAAAVAQSPAPATNGNRANGFSYQPTPSQVAPREQAAGVRPRAAQQERANRDLEQTDKKLLRQEGLSTKSVPNLTGGKPASR